MTTIPRFGSVALHGDGVPNDAKRQFDDHFHQAGHPGDQRQIDRDPAAFGKQFRILGDRFRHPRERDVDEAHQQQQQDHTQRNGQATAALSGPACWPPGKKEHHDGGNTGRR